MENTELKPCPFCGSSDIQVDRVGTHRASCQVSCMECGCSLESNEIGFGERWNDRAAQSQAAPARIVGEEEIEVEIDNYENGFIRLGVRIGIEWALSRQTAIVLPDEKDMHDAYKAAAFNATFATAWRMYGNRLKELNGIKEK